MTDFAGLVRKAEEAGRAAGDGTTPRAMIVTWGNNAEYVADGLCGFAWVTFPGNTPFGRWAKKAGVARPGYPKGLTVWVSAYNQSVARKEAYADAYAGVLKAAGIAAYSASRLD